ncbi:MAG: stage II sporulation protein M [Spirochaetaceae bacterium]|jgi:uncharacterized membrane protein SpoIIM required for sporulation|nr:stage II sporulation protein M [Spirochaetaceae bacterium]
MTEQYFLQMREAEWHTAESIITGGRKKLKKNAAGFPDLLHRLTLDLNTAKANAYNPLIADQLNRLVSDGNNILYSQRPSIFKEAAVFVFETFPQAVRANWKVILSCHLMFYGIYVFFTLLCYKHADLSSLIIDPSQKHDLLSMYDPESEYYLRPRDVVNDADMFGFYIYNNISIAFSIFAGGVFAGVGSLFGLIFNGIFLGAATGSIINAGFSKTFFSFTSGHSPFELTGIVLSASAGIILGWNFFFPKGITRSASVRNAGKTAAPIISGSALLLVFAAVTEAFFSSRHELPFVYHCIYGGFFTVLLLCYFIFCGRKTKVMSAAFARHKLPKSNKQNLTK